MKMYNKKKAENIIKIEKEKEDSIAVLVCDMGLTYEQAEKQINVVANQENK